MKNKMIFSKYSTIFFSILFFINIAFFFFVIPKIFTEISFKSQTVKISGFVHCKHAKDYKNGTLFVAAKSENNFIKGLPADIASTIISSPGKFSLRVPKMIGKVYLEALYLIDSKKDITPNSSSSPKGFYGLYFGNPLEVKLLPIYNVNIELFDTMEKDKYFMAMAGYEGPTINISGKVIFEEYKQGCILVMAKSYLNVANMSSPDINYTMLLKPGSYTLTVPKRAGKICIDAVNLIEDKNNLHNLSKVPYGNYEKNPLLVKESDMDNINITLSHPRRLMAESYKGVNVELSGDVVYDEYKEGVIIISAKSEKSFESALPPDIAITKISSPGKYTLLLPANIGKVYVEAINIPEGKDNLMPIPTMPSGRYRDNPITIGFSNIDNVNIMLSKKDFPVMDGYTGQTVKISGEIFYDNYEEGSILIIITDQFDRDINIVEFEKPGKFTLEVPKDIGNIYIEALNIPEKFNNFRIDGYKRVFFIPDGPSYDGKMVRSRKALPDIPYGAYPRNPIRVSSNVIKNIEITLLEKHFALMDTYKGATVDISGKINFKDFKDWKDKAILVSARTKRYYELYCEPDIAYKKLNSPGRYTLKVPKGVGEVYMDAVIIDKGDKLTEPPADVPYGKYIKNPVQIGLKNMEHIDIDLTSTYGRR